MLRSTLIIAFTAMVVGGWSMLAATPADVENNNWEKVTGDARDIAGGADGSIWIVGVNRNPHKWDEEGYRWQEASGSNLRRIAVDAEGTPWATNTDDRVFMWRGGNWQEMPGRARDIAAGADGSVWITGRNEAIYQWNEDAYDWEEVSGTAQTVTVAADGTPWVVNEDEDIYRRRGGNWQEMPGRARDIEAGADGSVWIIGENESVYYWSEDAYEWRSIEGTGRRVTVMADGTPWLINHRNEIYRGLGFDTP